jgi:hypothetical protein
MYTGTENELRSVLNPENYQLIGENNLSYIPEFVRYDAASRTVFLTFGVLEADQYQIRVDGNVESKVGLNLGDDYLGSFLAISDFLAFVDFKFSNPRSDRANNTLSYEVEITNTGTTDLRLPLQLLLVPEGSTTAQPQESIGQDPGGGYLIDLSDSLTDGLLKAGEAISRRTLSLNNPDDLRADFDPGIFTLPFPNQAPIITSESPLQTALEQPFTYQVTAEDPDGVGLTYLLIKSPDGMGIDPTTGLITWTPDINSPETVEVTLQVYDRRNAATTQRFALEVVGGNRTPIIANLPEEVTGREGELLEVTLNVNDPENDDLRLWVNQLPPGAIFDGEKRRLTWTPGFNAAGRYEQVKFLVTD